MGKAWAEASDVAAQTFVEAEQITGLKLTSLCFNGPADELNRTDNAQVAIYVSSVASLRALQAQGKLTHVAATAGLSLGEFTALHLAGAFDFATGLKLVQLRGRAMQDAAEASSSGMVALIGADEPQADEVCKRALEGHAGDVLVPANFNAPGQIVISGSKAACERSLAVASDMGLRATALQVAGAFHSPLMQPAAERLAAALEQVAWRTPTVPVMSNVTAEPHAGNDPASIKQRLVEQLTQPVRWSQCVTWLAANVQAQFVELAPGKVLSGLARRIDRNIKVENYSEPA
jgi:[acyl-carrier-protein] S-malonyltransferase